MTRFPVLAVLAAVFLLVACSSNPNQEEARQGKDSRDRDSLFSNTTKSTGRTALALPPDLLTSSADTLRKNQADSTVGGSGYAVLPQVIGATIHSDAERSWLEIDADAEVVWRKLTEFWAFEEIDLVNYQPESGVMETDWFVRTKPASANSGITGIAIELFNSFTSRRTALDKFTLRLERNGASGTRVFVTHRRREKISKEYRNRNKNTEFEWVERAQDPEKVAQLLQTIVLLFDSDADDEPA